MKQVCLLSLVFISLIGCASNQKPPMPENMYYQAASEAALLNQCGTLGLMSPDIAATGFNNIGRVVKTYAFDVNRLNSLIPTVDVEATKESCNKMAIGIQSAKQKEDQLRFSNQQAVPDLVIQTKPTSTYCNKVGATVMCNSF